ncbi:MAG: hypothetical protein CMP65_04950 [Flavobacteriales bacterium]|nr:hypothetical protein [Flavobacteriales bacterium]|tara:strand:- start:1279 stop:2742 length:1464 start_codon:yes stop_codon:yes gene_type:complete
MLKINNRPQFIVGFFSVLYLLILLFLSIDDNYAILILPVILSVILLAIFDYKNIFYPLIFLTPLSIPLSEISDFGLSEMALPTEPMLFGLLILTILQMIYNRHLFLPILKHPIVFYIFLYLVWMFITSLTSTMPIVSIKYFLSKVWFIFPLIFMGSLLFKEPKMIERFILLYIIPLSLVIIYTIIKHSGYDFDKQSAHYMMSPFFRDHTSYGAIIAFFLPLTFTLLFIKNHHWIIRFLIISIFLIMLIGFVLSFTRAAWLSLIISLILALIIRFKIDRRVLFSSPLILIFFIWFSQDPLIDFLEKNTQNTSDNLFEHVGSISNISTDASNVERINRWHCALYMFYDKPIYGFGPGTYQFQYAPYQLLKYYTVIRSNTGQGGNAHSEYLGPLSESGILGLISFLAMVIFVIVKGINMYYNSENKQQKTLILTLLISLLSYFLHGFFNNFLDTDKAAVPVWISIAILISLDLFYNKNQDLFSNFEHKKL